MAPFSSHFFSLGFSLGPSVQVFVVVLFIFVLSMVPLFVLSASFQSCFMPSSTQLLF